MILAEFKDNLVYFYPSKKQIIAVKPQDIKVVSQKNYFASRLNTQYSGSITVVTINKKIELRHVKDLASTRSELEKLRDEAIKAIESDDKTQ